ncbi:MAG: PAS domain S-box protein, partial [Desulfotignum sp.]|nr:PAS domain S-box protein [Desulfotignum sp.]
MTEKPTYEGLEKRVAELEQQAEQFQSAIYNSISHSIFVVDVLENNVFQYVSLNPRHEKITGISQDFIHGKTPEELLPEKAAQAVRHRYADCVNQKQNVTYEEWLPFQGKETCWETTLHPQINENGQVCQIIGTSQEITERVRYQNEIKESEERFRLLVESSPISVMMMRNGKYTYCNPASIALLGFNRLEDIFGMDALQTIAPEFHSTLRERMERVELGKSNAPIEIKIIKPNGDAVWTRSTSLSISIKGEPTAVIFGQDITKQRETEIALRESEEKHRSMMESMDDAAYICSSNYRIEYMNPAMIRKIGHDATGARCYKAIHGLEEQCPWCEHDKVIKGEPIKTELDLTKEDESFLISHSPIFHTNGSVSKLSIYRDITEKTKLEYRMQQSQKMESIGSLAGGIAHDFNNILFPIVGLSEMMLEDFPPGSLEQQNLNEIFQAGKRGRELIQQILSFSRRSEHQPIPVHIQKILKEVLKLCRATIPADITIAQDIMADCAPVMADPTQIHQIAMNLITNAYHAVEPAGGTIKVALKEIDLCHEDGPDVHLASGRYAVLSVIDTGTGIDPAVMNRIFDPYFTTKEKGRGTGLGLATVYGIVKDHG